MGVSLQSTEQIVDFCSYLGYVGIIVLRIRTMRSCVVCQDDCPRRRAPHEVWPATPHAVNQDRSTAVRLVLVLVLIP